jgi:hypothetical protein
VSFRWHKQKAIGLEIATAERLLAINVCGARIKSGSGAGAAGVGAKRQDNTANQGLEGVSEGHHDSSNLSPQQAKA